MRRLFMDFMPRVCFLFLLVVSWMTPWSPVLAADNMKAVESPGVCRACPASWGGEECLCLDFERNPFGAVQTPVGNISADSRGFRVVGEDDEVRWTVPAGVLVPKIKVTGLMQAGKGVAACAVVGGLGTIILRPDQRVVLTHGADVSWFQVKHISGREMSIRLETGDLVTGTFF